MRSHHLYNRSRPMAPGDRRAEKIRRVLSNRRRDITVVIENVHDPHNVSAILRTCDAVGILRVELLYTRESFPKIGKKSSSSANKWVDRRRNSSTEDCLGRLRSEGFSVYAATLGEGAVSLYELDLTKKVALVFGNEHDGVSDAVASQSDALFKVPMLGMIESLNVSVACGVTLYEALRQREGKEKQGLADDEIDAILQEWLAR